MAIVLPKGSIMHWVVDGTTYIPTEHNRSELAVDTNTIGSSQRMANGRLRKRHVADKHTWSCSWSMLPAQTAGTVDGNMGGSEIEQFFKDQKGEFTLRIRHAGNDLDGDYTVSFESFDKVHVQRGKWDFWDVTVTIEEV